MDSERLLEAPGWTATQSPLTYNFGYIVVVGDVSSQIDSDVHLGPKPVKQEFVKELPLGNPSTQYDLVMFVDVSTPDGATARATAKAISRPPENPEKLIAEKLAAAADADPLTVAQDLKAILDINGAPSVGPGETPDPKNVEVMEQVLDIMEKSIQEQGPYVTGPIVLQQAVVVAQIIQAGVRSEPAMNALEQMIIRGAENNLFSLVDTTLMKVVLHSIGSILPDFDAIQMPERRPNRTWVRPDSLNNPVGASIGMNVRSTSTPVSHHPDAEVEHKHVLSTLNGRQKVNHLDCPSGICDSCPTAYCDEEFLKCIVEKTDKRHKREIFTCCNSDNPKSLCKVSAVLLSLLAPGVCVN
jgi:hypothetical protein